MARADDDSQRLPPALDPDHPLLGLGYAPPTAPRPFTRLTGSASAPGEVTVAEEVPVSLVFNGHPHVVMMVTPADLEDFAIGFALSEGIVASAADARRIEVIRHAQGIEIQLDIPAAQGDRLTRARSLIGRTGCGLCGVEQIQDAVRALRPVGEGPRFSTTAIYRAERELPGLQTLNKETASLHAAAWATPDGAPVVVREDVGRHNALDKVIGALARTGRDPAGGLFVLTSRASYELVQKVVAVGGRLLATVSRPTGLAIRLADAANMTLVALLRDGTANVYAHGERIDR